MTDPDSDSQANIVQMRANLAETLARVDYEPRPSPAPILGKPPCPARMSRVILAAHRDAIGRRRRIGHPRAAVMTADVACMHDGNAVSAHVLLRIEPKFGRLDAVSEPGTHVVGTPRWVAPNRRQS